MTTFGIPTWIRKVTNCFKIILATFCSNNIRTYRGKYFSKPGEKIAKSQSLTFINIRFQYSVSARLATGFLTPSGLPTQTRKAIHCFKIISTTFRLNNIRAHRGHFFLKQGEKLAKSSSLTFTNIRFQYSVSERLATEFLTPSGLPTRIQKAIHCSTIISATFRLNYIKAYRGKKFQNRDRKSYELILN